jgi:hypothetical protein
LESPCQSRDGRQENPFPAKDHGSLAACRTAANLTRTDWSAGERGVHAANYGHICIPRIVLNAGASERQSDRSDSSWNGFMATGLARR